METFWGARLVAIEGDPVSASILATGLFEEPLTRALMTLLREGMVFVDVGAHIGYFSTLASVRVGPAGKVISYEPTPSTFAVLRSNVSRLTNVTSFEAAAWSESGSITLRHYGPRHSSLNSFTSPRSGEDLAYTELNVRAVRLDDELERLGVSPNFIKIDAESAERWVLAGLDRTLDESRPMLSVEVGDVGVSEAPTSAEVIELLDRRYAYDAFEWDGGLVPAPSRKTWPYENLVFLPRERVHRAVTGGVYRG